MLTQYRLTLHANRPVQLSWAYLLYASLLRRVPHEIGQTWHQNGWTPVSQHLTAEGDTCLWTVNLLDQESEAALSDILTQADRFQLHRSVTLSVQTRQRTSIPDMDALLQQISGCSGRHRLTFRTPTAFKSQKKYCNLPTVRLLLQSLIRSWNLCGLPLIPEEALVPLADGLSFRHFMLKDQGYALKGHAIPGFAGTLELENGLSGSNRQLVNALLYFSQFAGVGIKTTLGMGGTEHQFLP